MLLSKVRIIGHSMEPALKDDQIVIVSSIPYFFKKPRVGDIVILRHERHIIKRIEKIKDDKFFVVGDNKKESTDSRKFGWILKKTILGKVI
ncbi:MAG: nickel-type superoxide dismutase maturation protease [Candidatus Parcubacteria bacterium]|nr:nickel-type superoxide dismutase maturation protease [Candidatus Parcubacteria bacterium]